MLIEGSSTAAFERVALDAVEANFSHQTLRHEDVRRGGNEERGHAHFTQAGSAVMASLVWGVRKAPRWPVHGSIRYDFRSFIVADFPNRDAVRVLPQERSQAPGARKPIFGFTWLLVYRGMRCSIGSSTVEIFYFGLLRDIQDGVQRRRLSRQSEPVTRIYTACGFLIVTLENF